MRVEVTTNIEIARPLADVASYAFEPTNAPQWYANIKSVRWRTSPPVAEGSEMDFVAHFLGRELAYTYRVVELTHNRLVMRTAQGPFPMETAYQLQATGPGGTRFCLTNRGEPRGFVGIVAPIVAAAMRAANRKDVAALKRVLESGIR
ncbi:hypothetical protein GGR20_002405 [Devosia subaequoris]|uniref:ATPase n=1 Tax=Devosia subaequoris TaxID=395930 RepID=A0A7W6INA2_9HYPH|nr:SRPBCC family protein [Devosia subaequoris]MBB4052757.1 hypothetical protein [Devosia subaequoris]MCP1209910.1 SRPBCC family protein [Devosia subaequoris]